MTLALALPAAPAAAEAPASAGRDQGVGPSAAAARTRGVVLLRAGAGRAALSGPAGYLVVPFENRSQSAGLSWMTTALAATTAENLEGVGPLRPAYGAAPLAGLPVLPLDPGKREALALAQRARAQGAALIIAGQFDRVEWRYGVGLRAYRVVEDGLVELARSEARSPSAALGAAVLPELLEAALRDLAERLEIPEEERAPLRRRPTRDSYAWTLYGRALTGYYALLPRAEPEREQTAPPRTAPREVARPELTRVQATLQRVCFIDPRFAEAHRMLGLVYQDQGEAGKALGQYAHALDLRPDYYAALWGQAQLYRQTGARARAQEVAERALKVRPYDQDARLLLGELLAAGGKLVEAQAELLRVVAARPDHVAARRSLALVYAGRGMTEELAEELSRVLALTPEDLDARMDLAAAHVRMGSLRKALAVYEEVLRRRPRSVQAYRLLGDVQRRLGEPERAAVAYQRMVKLAPEDPRGYFLLARALIDAGQDARAERVLQDAQQFRRHLRDAWSLLGALELRRNDLARAYWYLSRAAARPGARPLTHYNFAVVLQRMNQPERAAAELRTAVELDPQDAELRRALAQLAPEAARPGRPE